MIILTEMTTMKTVEIFQVRTSNNSFLYLLYNFNCNLCFIATDSELLSVFTDSEETVSDYTPFTNKIHALLFMLINSPRPVVSDHVFFWFLHVLHDED